MDALKNGTMLEPDDSKLTLADLEEGVLVFAVARPYQGKGETKLILHKITPFQAFEFGYGNGKCLVTDLPSNG